MPNSKKSTIAKLTAGAIALMSVIMVLPVSQATAQQACLVRDDVIKQLDKQYGETVSGRGLTQTGEAMVELFANKEGSWTLVVTDVAGQSCIIAAGDAWQKVVTPIGVAS